MAVVFCYGCFRGGDTPNAPKINKIDFEIKNIYQVH